MRIIIQRVTNASVTIASKVISSINKGYVCLVGIESGDCEIESKFCIGKIMVFLIILLKKMKMFDDESGKPWQKDIVSMGYDILCVSNFTLYAHFKSIF